MSTTIWDREFEERVGQEEGWIENEEPETPVSQEILGLLNLGRLTLEFKIRDHTIVLRTLTMDEELEIGLIIKEYEGTQEWGRALATALVAASIVTLDDKPLIEGLGPDENLLPRRINYIRRHMYWPVINIIYEDGYVPLALKQQEAIDEFRKK